MEEFSRTLTRKVFVGGVERAFIQAATLAANVAVSVEIQPIYLAGLPWEFLRDPIAIGAPFLAKEHGRRLTRVNAVAGPARMERSKPVVLAVAVAAPERQLDFREERAALEKLRDSGFIELQWLEGDGATYDGVNDALRAGRVQIFHFAGHGDFAGGDPRGEIVLHDGPLTADRLATLFGGSGVKFAFLQPARARRSPAPTRSRARRSASPRWASPRCSRCSTSSSTRWRGGSRGSSTSDSRKERMCPPQRIPSAALSAGEGSSRCLGDAGAPSQQRRRGAHR